MKILLIGRGSIGRRHWRILKNLNDWGMFDIEVEHFRNWESTSWADVAFICNPTDMHINTALRCAEMDMDLFIEKPIDCKLKKLNKLVNIIESNALSSYVAYPLRFCRKLPDLTAVKEPIYFVNHSNLKDWRNHKTYSTDYLRGGGAVLECSHELDLAEYLLGQITEIDGTMAWQGNDETNAETHVYIRATHKSSRISWHSYEIMSDKTQRFIKFGDERIDIGVTDQVFLDQAVYFLNNLENGRMMNNLLDASRLFKKIIEFRNNEYAKHYNDIGQKRFKRTAG